MILVFSLRFSRKNCPGYWFSAAVFEKSVFIIWVFGCFSIADFEEMRRFFGIFIEKTKKIALLTSRIRSSMPMFLARSGSKSRVEAERMRFLFVL